MENFKQVIIAEKPSVAREIASVLGVKNKEDGYLYGNGIAVTWAFGHLIGLAFPEEYGITSFRRESLPILPEKFKLIPRQVKSGKEYKADPGVLKQLKTIKELFGHCDRIVVATDAGREGQLIFQYIYDYIGCNKEFDRLWISSLTERAIREGFQHLQPGTNYNHLSDAAKARSEADWMVGLNATQALTVAAGYGIYSLGRVQTPTLMMICNRALEHKNFVPSKYWQLQLQTGKSDIQFSALTIDKYESPENAHTALQQVESAGEVVVQDVERKTVNQEPPLLYDLTALQKEANTKLNFSADKTLSIAQILYEKKYLSYPRTGSRYISEDVFEEIPSRIEQLAGYDRFKEYAGKMIGKSLNNRSVDGSKVTDHHALIITENAARDLTGDEKAIYELVAGRLLEAFSEKCIKEVTTVKMDSGGILFTVKGTVIKSAGWRAVFGATEEDEEKIRLPELIQKDILTIHSCKQVEKQTKPKPLHTESSLLSVMESCGRELDNEEEREAMKEVGIGTPATRAAIIETLFARGYVVREKKSLVPTEKGLAVYHIVKDKKIADIQMTGMWENALAKIEKGEMDANTFHKGIEVYVTQITTELLNAQVTVDSADSCTCPKCKKGRILFFPKVAKCSEVDCGLTIFRERCGKQLTGKQIVTLVTKGKTEVIKGLKGKSGKVFDASFGFDEQFNVIFIFPDKPKKKHK